MSINNIYGFKTDLQFNKFVKNIQYRDLGTYGIDYLVRKKSPNLTNLLELLAKFMTNKNIFDVSIILNNHFVKKYYQKNNRGSEHVDPNFKFYTYISRFISPLNDLSFRNNILANRYSTFITHFIQKPIENYLDMSTGDGYMAEMVGNYLNVGKNKIYGADINNWYHYNSSNRNPNITFGEIRNGKIPFEQNFDLVTVFMAIHHITSLNEYLQEIANHQKSGNYLVIADHDIVTRDHRIIADVEHHLWLIKEKKFSYTGYKNFKTTYLSIYETANLLQKFGYVYISHQMNSPTFETNIKPSRSYISIYKKI